MSSIISRRRTPAETDSNKRVARIGLRQIVAKISIKTGITAPPARFRNLRGSRQQRLPIASKMLKQGPFLMKLVAGLGKT
jgi:hypothetical protein